MLTDVWVTILTAHETPVIWQVIPLKATADYPALLGNVHNMWNVSLVFTASENIFQQWKKLWWD